MSKLAYLECPTGIAGDMCLGALINAGVPLNYLVEMLSRLGIAQEYQLWTEQVQRNGQQATKVHVELKTPVERSEPQSSVVADVALSGQHHHNPFHSATEGSFAPQEAGDLVQGYGDRHHHHHDHSHSHSHSHSHNATEISPTLGSSTAENANHPSDPGSTSHSHSYSHSHSHSHTAGLRCLPDIEQMITAAKLPARVEAWSLAVFRRLAEAEGAVHGISPDAVHFHEVGATDAIIDIVGTCLGLDWLGIDRIYCSPLPTGGGTIRAAHGRLPVPAPAVLKLWELRQIPLYSNGIERELVTPTGAAIATTLAAQFGPPPAMTLLRVGLGAGSIDLPLPNILRLWIGEGGDFGGRYGEVERQDREPRTGPREGGKEQSERPETGKISRPNAPSPPVEETIALLETQIDDLNPQAIGYVYEALFAVGALDVFTQAIAMKKSRPGMLLTVICRPEDAAACETVIFRETTTLGIRRTMQSRRILQRQMQSVQIDYGIVRVKVAWANGDDRQPINVQPEYEDCAAIARQQQLPWREVHRVALQAWYASGSQTP